MADCLFPLLHSVRREATSTDTFTARTPRLHPGEVMEVCAVGARNLNSASKVIDIGIVRQGRIFYMKSVTLATAGIWYFTRFHIKVPSDHQVIFRIITPTDGDLYTFNVFAYMEPGSSGHIHSGE